MFMFWPCTSATQWKITLYWVLCLSFSQPSPCHCFKLHWKVVPGGGGTSKKFDWVRSTLPPQQNPTKGPLWEKKHLAFHSNLLQLLNVFHLHCSLYRRFDRLHGGLLILVEQTYKSRTCSLLLCLGSWCKGALALANPQRQVQKEGQ